MSVFRQVGNSLTHSIEMLTENDIKNIAEEMLFELESNYPEVVLIPAKEKKHEGHQIRAVQFANAEWYQKFCAKYERPTPIKLRTIIVRQHTINALKRLIKKGDDGTVYVGRLLDFINQEYQDIIDIPF